MHTHERAMLGMLGTVRYGTVRLCCAWKPALARVLFGSFSSDSSCPAVRTRRIYVFLSWFVPTTKKYFPILVRTAICFILYVPVFLDQRKNCTSMRTPYADSICGLRTRTKLGYVGYSNIYQGSTRYLVVFR